MRLKKWQENSAFDGKIGRGSLTHPPYQADLADSMHKPQSNDSTTDNAKLTCRKSSKKRYWTQEEVSFTSVNIF